MIHKDAKMESAHVSTSDQTPAGFRIPAPSIVERHIKRPVRQWIYPVLTAARHAYLVRRYGRDLSFRVDRWLLGQKGNDYAAHRRRINGILPLRGKDILIVGCGTGHDVPSWLPYEPRSLTATDYFSYDRAWREIREAHPGSPLTFAQDDMLNPRHVQRQSVDVIGSDAVLEHVSDVQAAAATMHGSLRPGGIVYATWGALWYCWAGDHASGYDGLRGGYNHLLLEKDAYDAYLDAMGPYRNDPEDGRLWAKNGLFSYLRPKQYLDAFAEAGFDLAYSVAILEPRAIEFLDKYPEQAARLRAKCPDERDLLITGMSAIWRKRR
jgi:SAM-dependent methyltransferase